jgi:hypothetical protein
MNDSEQIQEKKNETVKKQKRKFIEPKLTYIEPKLVKHGDVKDITAAFLGVFYP